MAELIRYHVTDTYSYSQITGIDSTGILFSDGQAVLFEECAKNFARNYPESRGTCVAEREALRDEPYFEFYQNGKSVRVVFDGLGRNAYKHFEDLRRRIESYGYTTFDLT